MARNVRPVYRNGNILFQDDSLSTLSDFWKTCPLMAYQTDPTIGILVHDHFAWYLTATQWASTLTHSGTASVLTTGGTILQIVPSDGTVADNDNAYVGLSTLPFLLAPGKDIWFEARVRIVEANTDDQNSIVGLCSTSADATLQNNGAGPPANYHGLVFFKVDGGTVWQAESSAAASQTTNSSIVTRAHNTWVNLGLFVQGNTAATYYVNGTPMHTSTTNLPTATMKPIFGVKNGDTNNEAFDVDWMMAFQLA